MFRLLAACVLFVCAAPATASAEWQFAPFVGLTFAGNTSIIDPEQVDGKFATERVHWNFGGSVSYLTSGIFGVEGLVTWTPGFFQQEDLDIVETSRTVAAMGNLVITIPRRLAEYSLRPYFSGGFGLLHAKRIDKDVVDEPALWVNVNLLGYNLGGGAIGFLSEKTGIRFDVRYFSTVRPQEVDAGIVALENRAHLRYMTASVGVVIRR
jgi:hypothetical protein